MPTSTPCYTLLKPRLARLTRALSRLEHGEVGAVHAARVAARRLRELLPVLQLEAAVARKLGARLRKLARRLGRIRDVDVMLGLVTEMEETDRRARLGLIRTREDLQRRRVSDRAKTADLKAQSEGHRAVKKLERILEDMAGLRPSAERRRAVVWAIKARVARRAAALKQAIDETGSVYLPERLHSARIAAKKLRYAAELLADTAGSPAADLRTLERAQELLGRLHDMQTLVDRVRRMRGSMDSPDLKAWRELDALGVSLERRCRRLHAGYVRDRAALLTLCDRLAGAAAVGAKRKVS